MSSAAHTIQDEWLLSYAAGNLKSDSYQNVTRNDGVVEITPVSDDVINIVICSDLWLNSTDKTPFSAVRRFRCAGIAEKEEAWLKRCVVCVVRGGGQPDPWPPH